MSEKKTVINVNSYNQSGGLTVGQIDQNNFAISKQIKQSKFLKTLTLASLIIGIVASTLAVFSYFGVKII